MADNILVQDWPARFLNEITSIDNGGRYKVMTSAQCQTIIDEVSGAQINPSSKTASEYRKLKRFQVLVLFAVQNWAFAVKNFSLKPKFHQHQWL